jgi:hypothetical protein
VVFTSIPRACQERIACNAKLIPDAPDLDAAVAVLDDVTEDVGALGPRHTVDLIRTTATMRQDDRVAFMGSSSGLVLARLGGVTIWYEIGYDDGFRCFGQLFEMKGIPPRYTNLELAKPGDSGAWVTDTHKGITAWDGVLIGRDDGQAYGCFASRVVDEYNNHIPRDPLIVFP